MSNTEQTQEFLEAKADEVWAGLSFDEKITALRLLLGTKEDFPAKILALLEE